MQHYIVLDLEWNQSPAGKEGQTSSLPFEIIEIGAVKLNESMKKVGEFRRLIRPQVYGELHSAIADVVHMDMEELKENGVEFPQAFEEFIQWCGSDGIYCTWGSMDLTELQRNAVFYGMENPFPKPFLYYDIQKLYSLQFRDGREKPSLELAVERFDLEEGEAFHRALADAGYTAKVLSCLDFETVKPYWSVDYYRPPANREEEIYLVFPDYSKYLSRTSDSKEEAIEDKLVSDLLCYRCKRMLKKKVKWFSVNQKYYFALGSCPEHGYLKGKIRMKKSEDGKIFAVKTQKLVSEEYAKLIYEKREETKKKRTEKLKLKRSRKKGRMLKK